MTGLTATTRIASACEAHKVPAHFDRTSRLDAITAAPRDTPAHALTQELSAERHDVDCIAAYQSVVTALSVEKELIEQALGREFSPYDLGTKIDVVRALIWQNSYFRDALHHLRLPLEQIQNAYLPWWNEIACAELAYDPESITTLLGPRHSLETQYIRKGFSREIKNCSGIGIIRTLPEAAAPEGFITLGLRGGINLPNTYHFNAGALQYSPLLRGESIYKTFLDTELSPEYGIAGSDISKASFLGRIDDQIHDKGPSYGFEIYTALTRAQLEHAWNHNKSPDKAEHRKLLFIPATTMEVQAFIDKYYRGAALNDPHRVESDAVLLHPSALALKLKFDCSIEGTS